MATSILSTPKTALSNGGMQLEKDYMWVSL